MLREANLEGRSLIEAIIHGFFLALGLILPLGAQNIFIFNQGANYNGLKSVAPVIIAAGCCDTFLILLAVLGVSLIFYSLPMLQVIIYVIGLVFLLYMAWTLWNEQVGKVSQQSALSVKKQITFAMSVSLLNPHAVMDTVGVIGTNATLYHGEDKVAFTIATIVVSWIWFVLLAILGKTLHHIDKRGKWIVLLNKISSIIILVVVFIIIKQLIQLFK
jgi:L-lysine exporter family protein LysE/ArgO